ncbi:MAG TPA: hypothetical protein VGD60_20015 [Candidatus Acidoferrales bacterium]
MTQDVSIRFRKKTLVALCAGAAGLLSLFAVSLHGQGGMQEKMGELKASMAKNKAALATYTWQQTVVISLKGQEKKTQHYQVQMGADGKPQKTSLDPAAPPDAQPSGGRGGRLKQRIVEKKKEEYEDYAESMKTLAQQYVPPDKDAIQGAYAKGNVSFSPGAGSPDETKIVIKDYIKAGDSMTILFNKTQKQISSITIASYMDDPTDAMNLTVQFSSLPDGTSHVSSSTINGVQKQLSIATQNSNYRKN